MGVKAKIDDPNDPFIYHDDDKYYPVKYVYEGYPTITGCPKITWTNYVLSIRKGKLSTKKHVSALKTPSDCALRHVVNYPVRKWGSFQGSIIGTYGYGKSNLLSLILAFLLARNHRIIMFDDSSFEVRQLAPHGFYDKNNKFIPFKINVFIPKGYTFDETAPAHNPMWTGKNKRNNVNLIEISSPREIMPYLTYHKLNVFYTESLDEASLMRFWADLMGEIKRYASIEKSYIFAMHELADLFPESPMKEIYGLTEVCRKIIKRFRKDRIGILTSYHENADVTYKISRKFGFVFQKRPVNKKNMSAVELKAKHFNRGQVNISQGGYWREHKTGMFPEMKDKYRVIANPNAWGYGNGKFYEPEPPEPEPEVMETLEKEIPLEEILTQKELEAYNLFQKGYDKHEIADVFQVKYKTMRGWFNTIRHKKLSWLRQNGQLQFGVSGEDT